MRSSGKLVVLTIFVVAIAMASFALWWNWGMGHRSLDYWGESGALLIRDAESVTLLKLKPRIPTTVTKDPPLPMESSDWNPAETQDISNAKGLVHARHAFLQDASFDWNQSLPNNSEWQYAVLFQGKKGHIYVVLDLKNGVVGSSKRYGTLSLNSKTAAGWKLFIRRYFPSDASPAPAKSE